jgi:hypothetical protein
MSITVKVALRLKVAQALHASATYVNIIDGDIAATVGTAKNVVVPTLLRRSTRNIPDLNVLDDDAVSWISSWPTVQVILLDIDAIYGDILDADILKQDVGDEARSVFVCLDARAVFGVEDDGVCEGYVCYVVVWSFRKHCTW